MQTELLTLIFEEAKKQCESKNDSVGLGAMYSAIISVGRDSHVLEGKNYDIQEYEALRRAVARDEPEGTVVPPVKSEDSLTGQDLAEHEHTLCSGCVSVSPQAGKDGSGDRELGEDDCGNGTSG